MPVDFSKLLTNEAGNRQLDVFNKKGLTNLSAYNPAFTNNLHTLLLSAHGQELGGWRDPHFEMSSDPRSPYATNQIKFGLGDVARSMGPGTNDIHNLVLSACESGGCAPKEAFKLFPNLTNVVTTMSGPGDVTYHSELENALSGEGQHPLFSTIKWPNPKNPNRVKYTKQMFDINKMLTGGYKSPYAQ